MISESPSDPGTAPGAGRAAEPGGRRALPWVRDALLLIAGAWTVLALLRGHVADRYRVETSSMEPTLHGDPVDGDEVLVAKLPLGRPAGWPRVFDLVVVENRLVQGGPWLIKRLMVRGPADVTCRDGDLWVRTSERPVFRRLEKHPVEQADLLRTSFVAHGAAPELLADAPDVWSTEETDVILRGAAEEDLLRARTAAAHAARSRAGNDQRLPGHLSTARAQDSSFLDGFGKRLGAGQAWPRDLGMEFRCKLAPGATAVHAVVEYVSTYYSVRLGVDGMGRFHRMGEAVGEGFDHPPLRVGEAVEIRFLHLDGAFHVVLGDRVVHRIPIELGAQIERPLQLREPYVQPEPNLLHLAVASSTPGEVAARLFHLRALQDPFLTEDEGKVWRLETDELFLLGDNVHDSADSRDLVGDPFHLDDLEGRPWAIVGPASRFRWLDRPAPRPARSP